MAVRLYIGGLPPTVTPEELAQRFKSFGDVESAEVAPDKVYPPPRPGAEPLRFPRNFGFVSIVPKDEKSLARAVAAYSGAAWRGSTLRCKMAKPAGPERIAAEKVEEEEEDAAVAAEALDPIPLAKDGTTLHIRQPYRRKLVTVVLGGSEVVEERLHGGGGTDAAPATDAAAVLDYKGPDRPEAPRKLFEEHLREVRERQGDGDSPEAPGAGVSTDAVLAFLDQQAEATAERKRFIRELRQQPSGASWAAFAPPALLRQPAPGSKRPASGAFEAEYAEMNQAPPPQRIRTVDFLSDTDLQGLSSRPAVDLSRFGSDSDDQGPPPRRAVIPQVDGANDSSTSSDSESSESGSGSDSDASGTSSSSESDSGSDGSTSSSGSSDDEEAEKKNDSETSGSSGDEPAGDGSAVKKRRQGASSDSSDSDSDETSSDETTAEDAGPTDAAAGEAVRQGPGEDAAWMAGRLPAGATFYRSEPMVLVEAAWRAGREVATREVKERRRQALRQAGSGKRNA